MTFSSCVISGHTIDNKRVDLRKAASGKEEDEEVLRAKAYDPEAKELKKLFVGNLDFECSEDDLTLYFQTYGPIEEISIGQTPEGKSKGYAFINFESAISVDSVQENRPHSLNDRCRDGNRIFGKLKCSLIRVVGKVA